MSTVREAFVLPLMLLSVALLGGLRTGTAVRLVPPTLVALAHGLLLISCLVRAGVLAPSRLMNGGRAALENATGAVVLLALFAASSQVFNLLTPDIGLLHVIVAVFFFVQLLTTLSGVPDRADLLRALAVLLGSAFLLRFVVLESLYAPQAGVTKRVLTAVLQGVSLGAIEYEPNSAVTGYAAFAAIVLFLTGLFLLPPANAVSVAADRLRLPPRTGAMPMVLFLLWIGGCGADRPGTPAGGSRLQGAVELREQALRSARVWRRPTVPVATVNFAENPAGADRFRPDEEVPCRFVVEPVGGTTPKFNCERPGGDTVKVKYGSGNAELEAEVAASRLLSALGFGADRMYVVGSIRCFGCPPFPFQALRCLAGTGLATTCFPTGIDYADAVRFDPAVIERRMEGTRIEATNDQGWGWYELDRIDPKRGGSPRREVDAFRLMAVLLVHWDNKAENQQLVCLPGGQRADGSCARPFAAIQDLGATFGPYKLDVRSWRATPMWADARACRVSMKALPFGGGTFPDAIISEEGRRLLLSLLEQLSDDQIRGLFTSARVARLDTLSIESRDPGAWLAAFHDKIRQIRTAGPCASAVDD